MKSKHVFIQLIKEMAKICFNTLKIIVVKYGEIWFFALHVILYMYYGIHVHVNVSSEDIKKKVS